MIVSCDQTSQLIPFSRLLHIISQRPVLDADKSSIFGIIPLHCGFFCLFLCVVHVAHCFLAVI